MKPDLKQVAEAVEKIKSVEKLLLETEEVKSPFVVLAKLEVINAMDILTSLATYSLNHGLAMGEINILAKSYQDWCHLLNRLTVGKNYYYQDNLGNDYRIPKKVYKEIERICNERLDELVKAQKEGVNNDK